VLTGVQVVANRKEEAACLCRLMITGLWDMLQCSSVHGYLGSLLQGIFCAHNWPDNDDIMKGVMYNVWKA
jgi:hypothetical protein